MYIPRIRSILGFGQLGAASELGQLHLTHRRAATLVASWAMASWAGAGAQPAGSWAVKYLTSAANYAII